MKHAVLLGLLLWGCSTTPPANAPFLLAEDLADETIALVARDGDGDLFPFCTAVWVGPNEFVTAAHCATGLVRQVQHLDEDADVDTTGLKFVYFGPGQYRGMYVEPTALYEGTLRKIDLTHDIAIVSSDAPPHHRAAALAPTSPRTGEPVIIVGHPATMYWTQTCGHVAGHFDQLPQRPGPWLQVDGGLFSGTSGGGAFDYRGRLVGIASFIGPMPSIGFFVDVSTVRQFVSP